jgi:hypothetical protein
MESFTIESLLEQECISNLTKGLYNIIINIRVSINFFPLKILIAGREIIISGHLAHKKGAEATGRGAAQLAQRFLPPTLFGKEVNPTIKVD